MKAVSALLAAVLLLAVGIAQSQDNETCTTTCTITQEQHEGNGSWVIFMDSGVSYFYLQSQNVFVIYNVHVNVVFIIDGNSGTTTLINPDTGFGFIINVTTSQTFLIYENLQSFDLSVLQEGNYQVIVTIYEYISQYIVNVTDENTDTSTGIYFNIDVVLQYIYQGVEIEQWEIFQSNVEVAQQFQANFEAFITIVYEMYSTMNYTLEAGVSIFIAAITQVYKIENDVIATNIAQFAIFIIQTMDGKISTPLMEQYYLLITSTQDSQYIADHFTYLTWAIIGIGSTYENLDAALQAIQNHNVVQTHISTITDEQSNQYIAYNSMVNGTWVFKVMYTSKEYVLLTSSYTDAYLSIYDPKSDYVLVFAEGASFSFFNYKSGNGLVINGETGQATYVKSSDDEIVSKFEHGLIRDGFKAIATLVLETDNTGDDSFQADEFLQGLHDGKDLADLLPNDELRENIATDFSSLIENFQTFDYNADFGTNNLVAYMLANTQSSFFQSGFVKMIKNMYKFNISTKRFFIDLYAGYLYSIKTEWKTPMFENVNVLLDSVPNDNKPDEVISFIELYMQLSWKINVSSQVYYIDGSVNAN